MNNSRYIGSNIASPLRWLLKHIVTRRTIGATLEILPLCQLPLCFIDVSGYVLKRNVVQRVNGSDLFPSMLLEISLTQSGHPWLLATKFSALCAADPHFPCLGHSCTLCLAHMAPVRAQVSQGAGGSTWRAPWGAFWGGTPGALPSVEIWECCLRAVGPSGEIRLFLEVLIAQPAVIKASMFSKGSEYFAGYVRKNSGT